MRYWMRARRGLSAVQLQIAFLILGALLAAALLTYYAALSPVK